MNPVAPPSMLLTLGNERNTEHLIRFAVEDTGIGISSDDLQAIFEPFRQAAGKKILAQGTGLGLTISRKLVHLMGSELHVKSTPGQGSAFWFELRLPEIDKDVTHEIMDHRQIIGYHGDLRKILIVDDNLENRLVLREMLSVLGFDVLEARDGREGVEHAIHCQPDLILMDLMMPGMDGFEATWRLRQIPAMQGVPIIGVSANVCDQTREGSLDAGCDEFLTKPVDLYTLIQCVQRHLQIEWRYAESKE